MISENHSDPGGRGGTAPGGNGLRRFGLTVAVGGSALLVASGLVARSGDVPDWETGIFDAINDLPNSIDRPMWLLQLSGLLFVPAVLGLVAAWRRRWILSLALVLVAPGKLLVERAVVKQLVERQRPGTSICNGDLTCANFRDAPIEGLSFVSGHAMITAAVAFVVTADAIRRQSDRRTAIAVALTVMVLANGAARIYLGAHNPLDITGGVGAGLLVGLVVDLVSKAVVDRTANNRDPSADPQVFG